MKARHEQQAADEFRTLAEAEIEVVSGGAKWSVDLGPLGLFEFDQGCFSYTQISTSDNSWVSAGKC